MATGGFIGYGPDLTRSTGNAGANSIFLTALVAQQSGTATAVLLDCFSATPSTTVKALVYDGSHSTLLASSAVFTSSVINYNRFPLSAPLSVVAGNTYYVGYVSSTGFAVSLKLTTGPGSWFASGGQSVTTPANPLTTGSANTNSLMIALELDGAGLADFGFGPDQAAGVTLSASNTIATFPATSLKAARSIVTQLSGAGKWYAEILVGGSINTGGTGTGVGISTANWGVTQGTGSAAYVNWLQPNGILQRFGSSSLLNLSYVAGDVIGIAYDASNNLIWFNKNNGSWFGASSTAGNPVTGTGGGAVVSVGWPITIGASSNSAVASVFTLRDTAGAFQYTPPSGFSAWSSAVGPVTPPTASQQYAVSVIT
jgi:hypothetical protein